MKLALVTGASSGIGEALCRLLASKGIDLLISGRNTERLLTLKQQLEADVFVSVVPAELTDPEERKRLIEKIRENVPDLVINNAGLGCYGPVLQREMSELQHVIDVNCSAVMELAAEAARCLICAGKKGTILNVSSAGALQPYPYFAVYVASKAFVNQFSESFDYECRPYGVRVLASCPGQVATRFRERAGGRIRSGTRGTMVMSADFAAREIWKQIERGQPLRVFNGLYRLLTRLASWAPRSWIYPLQVKEIQKRFPDQRIRDPKGNLRKL